MCQGRCGALPARGHHGYTGRVVEEHHDTPLRDHAALAEIHADLMRLAGRLLHRTAQSEEEHEAADYIRERLRAFAPDTGIDPFDAIENYLYLFASYYSEFLVVSVLALWWPGIALFYGTGVFLAYLAEFMGYRVFARLLPHFESQNVSARILAPRPERLVIVTAYYDSGAATPLTLPKVAPRLRFIHLAILAGMMLVLATCAADAWGALQGLAYEGTFAVRWGAAGFVLAWAVALYAICGRGEDIRGANSNASGVAALLNLAERLAGTPLEHTDVWLVATGSHESWMAGMRHLLGQGKPDKHNTLVLNLESVGAGRLHYLRSEGFMHAMAAGKPLIAAAEASAPGHDAVPGTQRRIITEAHVPLARGYQTMTLMGLDHTGLPPRWCSVEDKVTGVDEGKVLEAAAFAEALLRRLDTPGA